MNHPGKPSPRSAPRTAWQLGAAALLWLGILGAAPAQERTYDRVASVSASTGGPEGNRQMLFDLIQALDRATKSTTRVAFRPFARSLQETAAGRADFHLPLIQFDGVAAPTGLAYVEEVDFGRVQFVIYSRQDTPVDANAIGRAHSVEVEAGHEGLLPFPAKESNCITCSLDKILIGRVDALVASADVVAPLLGNRHYKALHRAPYKSFLVRALVPAHGDSSATRRYLADGVTALKKSGEFWKIRHPDQPYVDWQP